jgi:hypothetical protein
MKAGVLENWHGGVELPQGFMDYSAMNAITNRVCLIKWRQIKCWGIELC